MPTIVLSDKEIEIMKIRTEAKKEVFDDIDKFRSCGRSTDYVDMIDMLLEDYEELKKKHLTDNKTN